MLLDPKLSLPTATLVELDSVLTAKLGLEEDGLPTVHPLSSGSANDFRHLVASYGSGRRVGLKAAARLGQIGNNREHLIWEFAQLLGAQGACRSALCDPIPNLGPLANSRFIACCWSPGINLDQLARDNNRMNRVRANPMRFLRSYGHWLAICLLFSIGDDHNKQWVWDEDDGVLIRVDTEDSFSNQTLGAHQFVLPLEVVQIRSEVQIPGSPARLEVEAGLRDIAERFRAKRQEVMARMTAEGMAHSNHWMSKSPDDFVRDAVASL